MSYYKKHSGIWNSEYIDQILSNLGNKKQNIYIEQNISTIGNLVCMYVFITKCNTSEGKHTYFRQWNTEQSNSGLYSISSGIWILEYIDQILFK